MNQKLKREKRPWGFRILVGGLVLGGLLTGVGLNIQADDRGSRRSGNTPRVRERGNASTSSQTSTPQVNPQPSGTTQAAIPRANSQRAGTTPRTGGTQSIGASQSIGTAQPFGTNQQSGANQRNTRQNTQPSGATSSGFNPQFNRPNRESNQGSERSNVRTPRTTQPSMSNNSPSLNGLVAPASGRQFNRGGNLPTGNVNPIGSGNSNDVFAVTQKERKDKPPRTEQPKPERKPEPRPEPRPERKPEPKVELKPESRSRPERSNPPPTGGNSGNVPQVIQNQSGTQKQKLERPVRVEKAPRSDSNSSTGRVEIKKPGTDKPAVSNLGNPNKAGEKIRIRKPGETNKPDSVDLNGDEAKTSKIRIRPGDKPVTSLPGRGGEGAGKGDRNPADSKMLDRSKLNIGNRDGKPGADRNTAGTEPKPPRLKDGQALSRDELRKVRQDLDLQQTKLKDGKPVEKVKLQVTAELRTANRDRLARLPREQLRLPVAKNGRLDPVQIEKLKLRPARDVFNDRVRTGDLNRITRLKSGQAFQMQRQFAFHQKGDLSRRMNLLPALQARGGWRFRHFGRISPLYARHCQPVWYAGPSFCGAYLWYPRWSPWVDWCWWDTCSPVFDPRPIYCRPVIYDPCSPWVYWQYPVWQPLPTVSCGTWVDVDPVIVDAGADLQLLATRFVDPGHPTQELGPRFRVWFRNNSPYDLNQGFNLIAIASPDGTAQAGLPESGVRIPQMAAGEIQSVDIRLPYAANFLNRDVEGRQIPFSHLNVMVDSHNELPEAFEANNGATLVRGDILPVDPVVFAADPARVEPNGIVHLAGEGFGPEPGKAMVVIDDQEFDAEILGWFDLGIQIRIPNFELTEATAADLVVVRGDGAASPPLTVEINPEAVQVISEGPGPEGFVPAFPEAPPLPEADAP